jgi:hypothetical protein
MKSALVTLFLCAISLAATQTNAFAQATASPEVVVRNFYEAYLNSLNQNEDPLTKRRTELSKLVTRRLMASLDRARKRGLDADYFLDAQDWDETWEKNITTSSAGIHGLRATVNVVLKGDSFGEHKLRVLVRKETGVWKIDSVNGQVNP